MKPSEPAWYEELEDNPLRSAAFTQELKEKIKSKALASTNQKKRQGFGRSGIVGLSVILAGAAVTILLMKHPLPGVQERLHASQSQTAVTDLYWQNALDAAHPDTRNQVLLKQSLEDNRMLIFSRRVHEMDGSRTLLLEVDEYEYTKESKEWSPLQQASVSFEYNSSEPAKKPLQSGWLELEHTPVFFGVIKDSRIQQIQVSDHLNHLYPAKLIKSEDGDTYWFVNLPAKADHYNVVGLDKEGNRLSSEAFR
ncbi:hypothetical protein AWM70_18020 [Paenibacillus yonginensis]|uniref:Uncharacterized protein n=1 Tax=Paenibacillus yonginensis TaxID=1462996 RepID=A0A1B1N4D8_9BACL|nr:hypothetical protein [Paenibacillus yonginensis]ANS76245.1 hypothetical protein AWM70_18020 [Paenibacillus yonginensis]